MLPGQLDMFGATAPTIPQVDVDQLDLMARRVAIASYLYYRHDVSMMPDGEYDLMCQQLADNWDSLSPLRQFMLGSPEEIRASGFHIKMTDAAESSAFSWMRNNGHSCNQAAGAIGAWKFSKEHRLRWAIIGSK